MLTLEKSVKNKKKPLEKSLIKYDQGKEACGTGVLISLTGKSSREVTRTALKMLAQFIHRGSTGIDAKTGDGCGIAWYGLDHFFQKKFPTLTLKKGSYSIAPMTLGNDASEEKKIIERYQQILCKEELAISAKRHVPVERSHLGLTGQQREPFIQQFVILKPDRMDQKEFERRLILTRLRFELDMEEFSYKTMPHIFSASSYFVIYKSLVKENQFGNYFADFNDPAFKASAGVSHARFATNTLPALKNIQPLSKFANNGENNALQHILRMLTIDPIFKNTLEINQLNLDKFSDSHIMSIYMEMLHLFGYTAEEIVASTIHSHDTKNCVTNQFYNLFALPFEGPNASIIMMENKIIIVRDKNGFRPQRGIFNRDFFYCGSELGPVDIVGQVFDLPPATPLIIDLTNGTFTLYEPEKSVREFHQKQSKQLKSLASRYRDQALINFSQDELRVRKLRAGWNDEMDEIVIKPLFHAGKGSISSMADQGPIEALVKGAFFDLGNFFKGQFSQVTNPPLAKKEEEAYMSTLTFIGKKPSFEQVGKELAEGFLLASPIVDNREMTYLQACASLNSKTISIIYPVLSRERGLQAAFDRICNEAIQLVRQGTTLLILSDLLTDDDNAVIPPVWIASLVDHALLKAGLRRHTALALQAASLLAGRDIAQAISIGGVDIVNPYLAFIQDEASDHKKQCDTYKESLRQELLGFMARMGISTVSAYRGTKGFTAYGLDRVFALKLGVQSALGGINLQDISRIILTNHRLPNKKGLGKYRWFGQEAREKIWGPNITNQVIGIARNNDMNSNSLHQVMEKKANQLKTGFPRGWLQLVEPQIWNEENPMTVCILGGGAAGFYQTSSLLNSGLPIKIIIIEKKHVNKFGLIGDGVAPDHFSTKNQARILRECLRDTRVNYFGGIEVGKHITYQALKEIYPCIIDCRGAADDIKLNVPGENIKGVIPASEVYTAYNSEFDPCNVNHWPLNPVSKSPIIGIIGNGNVAADLARIFLKNPDDLESTTINSLFLRHLKLEGPTIIHLFARGDPINSKIGLNELHELSQLDISMSASFDISSMEVAEMTAEQHALYSFFSKIHNKPHSILDQKRLHFHFQLVVKEFRAIGNEVEATFLDRKQKKHMARVKNFITAIGRRPAANIDQIPYASGWVVGNGGTLQSAENSANETTEKIKQDFYQGIFNRRTAAPKAHYFQLQSSVGNKELENILDWLENRQPLNTLEDFFHAKRYQATFQSENVKNIIDEPLLEIENSDPNSIVIYKNKKQQQLLINESNTLLEFLKKNLSDQKPPRHECDGVMICGSCAVQVLSSSKDIVRTPKEVLLLKANLFDPKKYILACAHDVQETKGGVFKIPEA